MKTISSLSLKNSPIPIAIMQVGGQIVATSDALFSFFEYSSNQTITDITDLFGEVSEAFNQGIRTNEEFSEDIKVLSNTGELRWLKANVYPLSKKEKLFHISFYDFSQKIEYDLAQQANNIAKVGSWTVDLVNNEVHWSSETRAIHELPAEYMPDLEKGINFYKEGESRECIIEAISECIASGKPFDLELIIITGKSNEKWVRAMGSAEQVNGKVLSLSGVFQDIDQAKRQRLNYEVLSDRLRVAINSANVGVWDFDLINKNLFWDEKMYDLYGISKSDFKGVYEAWESTIHPEDKERAGNEVDLAIKGEKKFDTEFRIVKKDGEIAFIHAEAEVFCNKEGKPYRLIGANTDVTRSKRRDQRLTQLLNVTEEQNQRLLDFTNIVSHNLRSNSSNISMLSGMLDADLPLEKQKQFIEMIRTSAERLDETIVQLNDVIKIQATSKYDMDRMPLRPMIDKVIESINGLVLETSPLLDIDIDDSIKVLGFKPFLNSVFLNLFTNAIKYREPSRQLKIEIRAKVLNDNTIISFTDNGIGINLEKNRSKIFGIYKTFHSNKDAKGVGLFITKNHMEAMGGKIEVQSTLGAGTTFNLCFNNSI